MPLAAQGTRRCFVYTSRIRCRPVHSCKNAQVGVKLAGLRAVSSVPCGAGSPLKGDALWKRVRTRLRPGPFRWAARSCFCKVAELPA